MNESCHTWTIHVTYGWVQARVNESCHTGMSHVQTCCRVGWFRSLSCIWATRVCPIWMSHIITSHHMWMSHATYKWVTPHIDESCHMWMNHVTCEWVMPHIHESRHVSMSHVTREWVLSHVTWLMFQIAVNAARTAMCCSVLQCVAVCCSVLQCVAVCCSVLQFRTWVIYHLARRLTSLSFVNDSFTCDVVCLSRTDAPNDRWLVFYLCIWAPPVCLTWMSHVIYEWVMSHENALHLRDTRCHTWMSHVTWERILIWHDSFMYSHVTWLIHMWHTGGVQIHEGVMSHENESCLRDIKETHRDIKDIWGGND